MKQACTTRVRYVVKIAISTSKNSSLGLNVFFAACVVALMPCESAQSIPSTWGQSGTTGSQGNSFFRPQGDIFQGATTRPPIGLPTGNFGQVPSAGNSIRTGSAANAGAAIRNIQTGNPMGAFRAIGGMGQQGASGMPNFGQIAQTVQAGAQIAGTVNQVQGALGRFQQGGSGIQNVAGMVGGAAGINQGLGGLANQGMGRFGQGGTPNLSGILGGLGGQTGNGMFGNGIGAGPFGQMIGQNGQVMQIAATFLGLLQSLFPNLFGGAGLFNPSNTGQSAQTAFGNLMGANSGRTDGVPPVSPITTLPCSGGPKNRTSHINELQNNPALRTQVTKLCVKEVGGQGEDAQVALFESMFNRSTAEGNTIDRAIHNGYYEPMNKGGVDSVSTSSAAYASCDRALNKALAGSNSIGCRRHQATNCDWARRFGGDPSSCVQIGGEAFYSKPGDSCDKNFC